MQSMTGFGRGEHRGKGFIVQVEIKSLNHRFQEIIVRLPSRYQILEERIRYLIRQRFHRGRFEIQARFWGIPPETAFLTVDRALALQYVRAVRQLKIDLGLSGDLTLSDLLRLRDIFHLSEPQPAVETLWSEFEPAFSRALEELEAMRIKEGTYLRQILEKHLAEMDRLLLEISKRQQTLLPEAQKKLKERILKLLEGQDLDPLRLHQEVAFLADRLDFSEELDRLYSHRKHFAEILKAEGPHGRKLDFLCQEMFREINTLSNKASSAEISRLAVEVKALIEKLREQVQNLE